MPLCCGDHRQPMAQWPSLLTKKQQNEDMIDNNCRKQILDLIAREVVPAVGCTEPMAVALCVARATEMLGKRPEKITVMLSANILKNAMGVGIPGTGMIGLPIAIALGALIGKSEYQLEVLKDLTPETLEQGKKYMEEGHIDIQLKQGQLCDKYSSFYGKRHSRYDLLTKK